MSVEPVSFTVDRLPSTEALVGLKVALPGHSEVGIGSIGAGTGSKVVDVRRLEGAVGSSEGDAGAKVRDAGATETGMATRAMAVAAIFGEKCGMQGILAKNAIFAG